MSIIGALFFAWFLSEFDLHTTLIAGLNELLGTNYSTNIYWLAAFVIGAIGTIIELIIQKKTKT